MSKQEPCDILESGPELSIFEAILARRSVRSYTSQEVDFGAIKTLLEAAVRAPTALHAEPWGFIVVQDRKKLSWLSERAKPLFSAEMRRSGIRQYDQLVQAFLRPEFNLFYDAGTLIIICANATSPYAIADCWLAAENLMLAASAMNLGTCIIGSAIAALNQSAIKSELGIPDKYSVFAPVIIGHPCEATPMAQRKEPVILAHFTSETGHEDALQENPDAHW